MSRYPIGITIIPVVLVRLVAWCPSEPCFASVGDGKEAVKVDKSNFRRSQKIKDSFLRFEVSMHEVKVVKLPMPSNHLMQYFNKLLMISALLQVRPEVHLLSFHLKDNGIFTQQHISESNDML